MGREITKRRSWTNDELKSAAKRAKSYREIALELGLVDRMVNISLIKKTLAELDIDFKPTPPRRGGRLPPAASTKDLLVRFTKEKREITTDLRQRIIDEGIKSYICAVCGQKPEWQNKPLILDLHHKDGNHFNHDLSNLEFLCPNCHTKDEHTARRWGEVWTTKQRESAFETYLNRSEQTGLKICARCGINFITRKASKGICRACSSGVDYKPERTWTDDDLKVAVAASTSLGEIAIKLNLKVSTNNLTTIKKSILELDLNVDHLTRLDWKKGTLRDRSLVELLADLSFNKKPIPGVIKYRLEKESLLVGQCTQCGLSERKVLQLHHRDGDHFNHDLSNLELLCTNCHSQTSSYRSSRKKEEIASVKELGATHAYAALKKENGKRDWKEDIIFDLYNQYKNWNIVAIKLGVTRDTLAPLIKRYKQSIQ